MLLCSCAEFLSRFSVRAPPELRQGTQSSSRVMLVPPINLQQVALGPFELQRKTQGSSQVAAVDLWCFSSFSDASSRVVAGCLHRVESPL